MISQFATVFALGNVLIARKFLRRWRVEGKVEVEENIPGAVVNVHLVHAGSLHHSVEGDEVFFDEAEEVGGFVLDTGLRLA